MEFLSALLLMIVTLGVMHSKDTIKSIQEVSAFAIQATMGSIALLTMGVYKLFLGFAGVGIGASIIGGKAVRFGRKWKPAPEQSFEPASRSYPATPERKKGETYDHNPNRQPRIINVKPEELIKISSKRPDKR